MYIATQCSKSKFLNYFSNNSEIFREFRIQRMLPYIATFVPVIISSDMNECVRIATRFLKSKKCFFGYLIGLRIGSNANGCFSLIVGKNGKKKIIYYYPSKKCASNIARNYLIAICNLILR